MDEIDFRASVGVGIIIRNRQLNRVVAYRRKTMDGILGRAREAIAEIPRKGRGNTAFGTRERETHV